MLAESASSKLCPMASKQKNTGTERAIWRGNVSFGLVQIPIGLFRAEQSNDLHFTMLDKRNLAPIRYDRKSSKTGKKLKWQDIVKGFEVSRGHFVVMTDDDFAKASVRSSGNLDITDFVKAADVDPLYFVRPYYMLPQKGGEKPYALLVETLRQADKFAVGKIVIRTRQHMALVRVVGAVLVLHLIRFAHELRDVAELSVPKRSAKQLGVGQKELKIAQQLVTSMSSKWRPEQYKDSYRDDLLKLIRHKKRAKKDEIAAPVKAKATKTSKKVVDIMDLLQRSVKGERAATADEDKSSVGSAKKAAKRAPKGVKKVDRPRKGTKKTTKKTAKRRAASH